MDRAGLEIEERTDVIPREGKPPLFSVFKTKMGTVPISPKMGVSTFSIVVRDRGGEWSDAFRTLRFEMGMPV